MRTIDSKQIEELAQILTDRFEEANLLYIELMAKHISELGKLTSTDIHRLEEMRKMNVNIDKVRQKLEQATNLTSFELSEIFRQSGLLEYSNLRKFYIAKKIIQPSFSQNEPIIQLINSMLIATNNTLKNISHTTIKSKTYVKSVDEIIHHVTTGLLDPETAIRRVIKNNVLNGLRVQYPSGMTRRLDSAVRLNVLEGIRRVNAGVRLQCGKQFGADGVQIDAHGLCASDHLPYQGKQFSIKAFNRLQKTLNRPIGTMNCQHNISYVILGVSPNVYDDEELEKMSNYSNEKIQVGNKTVTRYECSQIMRQYETKIKYLKESIIALDSAGIDASKEKRQLVIAKKAYSDVATKAGLRQRTDKMIALK